MKNDPSNGVNVCNIGYHFSRFRGKDWRRLYVENLCDARKSGRSVERRVLKLKGLYCVGILLMAVGFLICFNAVYRTPLIQKRESPAVVSNANAETGVVWHNSISSEGRGE
jgi:hypothetical protein